MAKLHYFLAPVLLACATSANAAGNKVAVTTEQTNFSGSFGKRLETSVENTTDLGDTGFTVNVTHGNRKFESESYNSLRLAGTIYHDWSEKFYTRTSAGVSSNKPVFATRELSNDFNYKLLPNAVATVGAKYARYYGGRDALSWSAGASWHFNSGFVTYRFSQYDVDALGKSSGHMATVRVKDGRGDGYTQLWAGIGNSLHEQEILLSGSKGKYRTLALQRVQPITGPVAVNLSIGRTWYDTPTADYRGTTASIGLAVSGLPKL